MKPHIQNFFKFIEKNENRIPSDPLIKLKHFKDKLTEKDIDYLIYRYPEKIIIELPGKIKNKKFDQLKFSYDNDLIYLPNNLEVDDLRLSHCVNLKELPKDIKVNKFIFLYNTYLKDYTPQQIKKMFPGIKGKIYV